MDIEAHFIRFAEKTAKWSGSGWTFLTALFAIAMWAITGPMFRYSDAWQLVINTSTTIITFLMVFLIQNSQNREAKAVQLKLNELIRTTEGAHTRLIDLERLSEEELTDVYEKYLALAQEARRLADCGEDDIGTPESICFKSCAI